MPKIIVVADDGTVIREITGTDGVPKHKGPLRVYTLEQRIKRAKERQIPSTFPGIEGFVAPRSLRVRSALVDMGKDVTLYTTGSRTGLDRRIADLREKERVLGIFPPEGPTDNWRVLYERISPPTALEQLSEAVYEAKQWEEKGEK